MKENSTTAENGNLLLTRSFDSAAEMAEYYEEKIRKLELRQLVTIDKEKKDEIRKTLIKYRTLVNACRKLTGDYQRADMAYWLGDVAHG